MTLASVRHILALTTIVRERRLPVKGTVTARVDQKVSPGDIVAEATWGREHAFLDVARALKVTPQAADRLLRCKAGDDIPAGGMIAFTGGLQPRTVRARRAGRVVAAGGGQILMESDRSRMELKAGISGTVIELISDRGVVIQTTGALVQGVWGNGRLATGVMINLAEKPDTVLTVSRLDVSMRGSILVAGRVREAGVLRRAADLPVRGLIVGSLFSSLLPVARDMRCPIVLTDGFGSVPMNSAAHRLIATNANREVTLNAECSDRYGDARPEVIIPLPAEPPPQVPPDVEFFAAGQSVLLRRQPAAGSIGTITSLLGGLTSFPSGIRAAAAEVKLENGEQLVIPLVNLEVVDE